LDSAGPAFTTCPLIRKIIFAIAIFIFFGTSFSFCCQQPDFEQLAAQERWQEIVRLAEGAPHRPAEMDYYYGLALAHLERWNQAHKALLEGSRKTPGDKRFPVELAGVDFKQKKYSEAQAHLRRALQLDSKDTYANDFMATLYFLQGNLEAAVKYWNRVNKPQIDQARNEPALHVNPVLLDHALAFSPASLLIYRDLLTSESRVEGLEIFPTYHFDLQAHADGKFDMVLRASERNGMGSSKLEKALILLRGLPFQEIDPEYFNIEGQAINVVSQFRWDSEKQRALVSLSGPWRRNPKWRYRLSADLRNENWDVRDSFSGFAPVKATFNLRREAGTVELTRFFGQHHSWTVGMQASHRDYRNVIAGTALQPQLLAGGYELKQSAQLDYELWRIPERRFTLESCASSQLARIWSGLSQSFAKLQACLDSSWFPQAQDDDLKTVWSLRTGKTFGDLPFDELTMLGLERDNDLWLRAHIGTRNGRKGSAPLGRNYFLSNWETDKNVYRNGLITFKLSPFVDTGRITDPSPALGSGKWLWDTGVQGKVSVLGVGVAVIYGKDLRSGRNAFYVALSPSASSRLPAK